MDRDVATQAMAASWRATEAVDERGRPLWLMPGRDGLVPLDAFRAAAEFCEAA